MRRIPYHHSYLCFITTVTKNRRKVFVSAKLAQRLATMIQMAGRMKGFVTLACAIMPDHVHLLIVAERTPERMRSDDGMRSADLNIVKEGALSRAPDPNMAKFIQSIKGTFARTMNIGHIWQKRYFCWYVADEAHAINVIEYIRYNFLKHGLPEDFGHEPFTLVDNGLLEVVLGGEGKRG